MYFIFALLNSKFVTSTDRKKDLVKLQAGEYVSLGKVESELKTCGFIENICVYGDPTKQFTVALVVPNQKHLEDLAERNGLKNKIFEELCSSAVMEKAILKEISEHARKCKLLLHSERTSSIYLDLSIIMHIYKYLQVNSKSTRCLRQSRYVRKSGRRIWV